MARSLRISEDSALLDAMEPGVSNAGLSAFAPAQDNAEGAERTTGTLGKVMEIVSAIADAPAPLRFTDLLHQLNQPRGTLHRNLVNLQQEGMISLNSDGHSYSLGPRMLQLATRAWHGNEFRAIAEPHLRALNAQATETVHLAILQDTQVVYLDKFEAQQSLRMHSQIGRSAPVYCTGVGKAILSGLDDESFEALAARLTFQRFTEHTLTTVGALRADRAQNKARGYAVDAEEHETGIRCAAAPIVADGGLVLGGISVTAPAHRVSDATFEQWISWVKATSAAIARDATIKMGPRR